MGTHSGSQEAGTGATATVPAGQPSGYSPQLVSGQNRCVQTLPMPLTRIEELPTELNRLFAAALENRARLAFDVEPARFLVALSRHSNGKA